MQLVIAEKPSVAADIKKAINACGLDASDYFVTSAAGHFCSLLPATPSTSWGTARDLPYLPKDGFAIYAKDDKRVKDSLKELVNLLKDRRFSSVINACDAGREGELIFKLIYHYAGCSLPVGRLWLQSMTPEAIAHGLLNLEEDKQELEQAAIERSKSDLILGFNLTRALTFYARSVTEGQDMVNAGRVLTPTLAIVVERAEKVENFKPELLYKQVAEYKTSTGETFLAGLRREGEWEGTDKATSDRFAEVMASPLAQTVVSATDEKEPKTRYPSPLFSLTGLQKHMNKAYKWKAAKTLEIAQELYEKFKALSYPRSDAVKLPEDYAPTCSRILANLANSLPSEKARHIASICDDYEATVKRVGKRVFNDAGITDHFAIIPTEKGLDGVPANSDCAILYNEVVRRFVENFMPPALFDKTTRTIVHGVDGIIFEVGGSILKQQGFLAFAGVQTTPDDDDEDGDSILPEMGSKPISYLGMETKKSTTKAPPYLTEAALLSLMETAGKELDDEDQAQVMVGKGLGTPATRAHVIEELLSNENSKGAAKLPFVEDHKGKLIPTDKGRHVIKLLKESGLEKFASPALTAELEVRLSLVEKGQLDVDEIQKFILMLVERIAKTIQSKVVTRTLSVACPKCGDKSGLVESTFSYQCACDCGFKITKTFCGHTFTQPELLTLARMEKTDYLSFVSKKSGAVFKAAVHFKPEFDFEFTFQEKR
jgi:DNA topoisomerase-3